jgi:NADH:ubiquinone oxidoreductase subunit B-like Fe-S oxidoreductase
MYRKVKADKLAGDVVFKYFQQINVKDWRRVEGLVRWMFITKCTNSEVELAIVAKKDIDFLRFLVEWELEKRRSRDMQINVNGKGYVFKGCRVQDFDVKDFRGYDGEALISLEVKLQHKGVAMRI